MNKDHEVGGELPVTSDLAEDSVEPVENTAASVRWRLFLKNRPAVVGGVILLVIMLLALLAPWLAPEDPASQELVLRRQPPGADAWFGRDGFGRDLLSRTLYGARLTLLSSVGAVVLASTVGSLLGLAAGYRGGWLESLIMRSMDVMLSFPYFLLAILVVAVAGPGLRNAAIAVAVAYIPQYARLVRGVSLEIKGNEYVEAAKAAGVGEVRIAFTHVLPNVTGPIIVFSTVGLALAVVGISSLSFLGLGAQPPTAEWGAMLAEGREFLSTAPHISYVPGLAILLTVLALNMMGDGLRDALDPRFQ